MLIVACKCLNIKASISVSEADRSICTPLESMPDYECIGPFRNPADLLIEIKHDELTRSCRAQATAPRTPWTLITCMICNQIVCGSRRAVTEASSGEAVHGESVPFEVVLNRKLLTSAEAISKMKLDVHFSKTFKVVIRPSPVQSPPRSPTDLLNSTDPRLKKLSAVLSERLRRETERTEDIIRQFTRDQFLNLSALRQEAESEFVKLAQAATVAPSHDQETSRYDWNNLMSVVGGNLLETPPLTPDSGLMSSPPELHSHNPPRPSLVSSKSCGGQEEDFFDMEDLFPGADEESSLSDDPEKEEDDDDDFNPRGRRHEEALEATEALQGGRYAIPQASRMASDAMMLAKSLPIPTPAMQERMRRDGPTIEESDLDIGNSIMALAKSVHGSDAIFGDLPRPRLCLKDHTTA